MRGLRKTPTSQMSDEVIVVQDGRSNVPLRNGERADITHVTIKSDLYPFSEIDELNWIEVIDVAQSGVGVTYEYDRQRKSLSIVLGSNAQIGNIKRKRKITKRRILTHLKWARRVVFGSWDRDLEKWIEEDDEKEARHSLAAGPGQFAGDQQREDSALRVDFEAGRKIDYLNVWRVRVHNWSRILEFVCLGIPIIIAYLNLPLVIGIPASMVLFVTAWVMDGVKSKNRKWKARLGE